LNAERSFVDRLEVFADVHHSSKTAADDGYAVWMEGSHQESLQLPAWTFYSYPWTIAALDHLAGATKLDAITRFRAKLKLYDLLARFPQNESSVESCCTFEIAENLYCARVVVGPPESSK
jgi:hypothetical protein